MPFQVAALTPTSRRDRSDVDFSHLHHRIERALGGSRIGIGDRFPQGDRCNLPGHLQFVLALTARTLLSTVVDDRVPVTIGFGLVNGCDLKRECFVVPEPPLRLRQGMPITVNHTVNTSPFSPEGKSPGARNTAPTDKSGKVDA